MKSVISNHEAPKEVVLKRIDTVTSSAYLSEIIEMGCLEIMVYMLGNLKYNITYINASVLTFELENVYCFKFQEEKIMLKDLIEILEGYGVYIYVHTVEKDDKKVFQVGCINDCYTEEYNTMEDVENCLLRLIWSEL